MQKEKLEFLKEKAAELRKDVITMIYEAQSGHPGGSLSAADFVAALYFSEMKVDPKNPKWPDRDRFVLSKGHACPIQYAALAELGFFDKSVLSTLRKEGSILQGHPDMKKCPGIDISTGSLGQGFACGAGMALAAKLDGKDYRVFVVIGDGESQEGEIWEAAQVCNKYKLDNIVVFCDYNNLQIDGTCDEVILALGLITPPVGVNLFTGCGVAGITLTDMVKKIWPFVIAVLIVLLLVTYIPQISTILPSLMVK